MVGLSQTFRTNIVEHIQHIYLENELDGIISLGYRVKS